MDTAQTRQGANPAEEIWAILRENAQQMKETYAENARQMKETYAEIAQRQAETAQRQAENAELIKEIARRQAETDRQMKENDKRLNKQIGDLGNRFGEMVEYMVVPNLLAKFEDLGFTFTKATKRTEIKDKEHKIFIEIDAFLENGDKVMIVEIKSKPNMSDIKDHVKRMEKLRVYADLHNDKRVYLGAIAGAVFNEGEKIYALKRGFYVIEPSGDTFNITAPEGEYHLREW